MTITRLPILVVGLAVSAALVCPGIAAANPNPVPSPPPAPFSPPDAAGPPPGYHQQPLYGVNGMSPPRSLQGGGQAGLAPK
jgi:hypothetical protein